MTKLKLNNNIFTLKKNLSFLSYFLIELYYRSLSLNLCITRYLLRFFRCKPNVLNPRTVSFIFKQFCLYIIRSGLNNLHIKNYHINLLNIRQNIPIKKCTWSQLF